jgi:hypothetical protein
MELGIIVLTSLCCVGWHVATDTILHHVTGKGWGDHWDGFTKWQKTVLKPLAACPTCMASICGTVGHFYLGGELWAWPVTVLAVAYLNTLLIRWVE